MTHPTLYLLSELRLVRLKLRDAREQGVEPDVLASLGAEEENVLEELFEDGEISWRAHVGSRKAPRPGGSFITADDLRSARAAQAESYWQTFIPDGAGVYYPDFDAAARRLTAEMLAFQDAPLDLVEPFAMMSTLPGATIARYEAMGSAIALDVVGPPVPPGLIEDLTALADGPGDVETLRFLAEHTGEITGAAVWYDEVYRGDRYEITLQNGPNRVVRVSNAARARAGAGRDRRSFIDDPHEAHPA